MFDWQHRLFKGSLSAASAGVLFGRGGDSRLSAQGFVQELGTSIGSIPIETALLFAKC
jgi:hypothetical protein